MPHCAAPLSGMMTHGIPWWMPFLSEPMVSKDPPNVQFLLSPTSAHILWFAHFCRQNRTFAVNDPIVFFFIIAMLALPCKFRYATFHLEKNPSGSKKLWPASICIKVTLFSIESYSMHSQCPKKSIYSQSIVIYVCSQLNPTKSD